MPLIETKGAGSAQGFGEFSGPSGPVNYIEDVFSTYLFTGNGSTQTITNGIDLSGKGGLVWTKNRGRGTSANLIDTVRGVTKKLVPSSTAAEATVSYMTSFNSTGYTINGNNDEMNLSSDTYVSWTFRKQPKFFDVVTYTGNGVAGRQIPHSLGSTPGCFIIKRTDTTGGWVVLHRGTTNPLQNFLYLDTTQAADTGTIGTGANSTTFTVTAGSAMNANGGTYVAYLFAHNAGGFGLSGSDNVISCGSYTGTGSTQQITLGYEPQWVMIKRTDAVNSWIMVDNMRGFFQTADNALCANNANAEAATVSMSGAMQPTATGFSLFNANSTVNASGGTYIYIAIRRGPMEVPTSGTSVFSPVYQTFSGSTVTNTGFVVDMVINKNGVATTSNNFVLDRLRGSDNGVNQQTLPSTSSTAAEVASSGRVAFTGSVTIQNGFLQQDTTANNIVWAFRRAPGFFDEVCYTGTGASQTVSHNLQQRADLIICKARSTTSDWGLAVLDGASTVRLGMALNSTATGAGGYGITRLGTSTTFDPSNISDTATNPMNSSGVTYVAYLFATCAGVSKVGSYTGTGTTLQVNCGFTGGSRFVLIKRTDSTGDWYVWDSARGIVAGNDPYLLLNSTAAEVTNTDYVDTYSAGFEISSTAPAAINANGGTFIFLAIA
jgi:hypothetical protein